MIKVTALFMTLIMIVSIVYVLEIINIWVAITLICALGGFMSYKVVSSMD